MTEPQPLVVTIDGPSGAGKGTVCRLVAQRTGFQLLDSGALYRITALAGLNQGVDLDDAAATARIAAQLDVSFEVVADSTRILLDGSDITQAIREERIGMGASQVAVHPAVRQALLQRQRDFARAPGLVADGRDMGTVVFPAAAVKVFLTASAEERARRRVKQLAETGVSADYAKVLQDIQKRDEQDSNRASAPLKPAADAVLLDSTRLSIEQVLQQVLALVARQQGGGANVDDIQEERGS